MSETLIQVSFREKERNKTNLWQTAGLQQGTTIYIRVETNIQPLLAIHIPNATQNSQHSKGRTNHQEPKKNPHHLTSASLTLGGDPAAAMESGRMTTKEEKKKRKTESIKNHWYTMSTENWGNSPQNKR